MEHCSCHWCKQKLTPSPDGKYFFDSLGRVVSFVPPNGFGVDKSPPPDNTPWPKWTPEQLTPSQVRSTIGSRLRDDMQRQDERERWAAFDREYERVFFGR